MKLRDVPAAAWGWPSPVSVVRTEGGEFDDGSFIAGWIVGNIYTTLHDRKPVRASWQVPVELVDYLQGMALEDGYKMETLPTPYNDNVGCELVSAVFTCQCGIDHSIYGHPWSPGPSK